MNTHVFIVDDTTFKVHLEYMFAGIGSKDKTVPFLSASNTSEFHHSTERVLTEMIADISRIQIGDNIIFYLQASQSHPGMFFGIFKAKSRAFFDENDKDNYLKNELRKGLSFRILIGFLTVYQFGITEHEYLDIINDKLKPYHLNWSLIYRKLKGNRGCTMITDFEFLDLKNKLEQKNNFPTSHNSWISCDSDSCFSYNTENNSIILSTKKEYHGRQNSIDITDRLLYKFNRENAFETHLQAYLLQNLNQNICLKNLILPLPSQDFWIGNEVSCGVGMQSIDLLIIQSNQNKVYIKVIELKDEEPTVNISEQLSWYTQWVQNYIAPNYVEQGKAVYITPTIIAKETNNNNILNSLRQFNTSNFMPCVFINSIEYISFSIDTSTQKINFLKTI